MKPNAMPQISPSLNHPKRVKALLAAFLLTTASLAEAQSPVPDNFNPGAGGSVLALAVQADGKIVVGGGFTTLGGQTRVRLGRLTADGSLDTSFSPQASATVYSLAVQPDGKILVGGDFTSLAGYSRTAIGRLNTNGTLDTAFTMTVTTPPVGYSQTVRVQAILVQPDGKLVVGGRTTLTPPVGPTITTGFISRLNTNGTTDMSFITTSGVNGPVTSLAFQADGRILAGGLFTTLRGQTRNRLGRLNADGSLDTAFNPGANSTVLTLAVQGDDMILVGGAFSSVGAEPRTNLARLYPDGTVDAVFAPAVTGSGASVYSLALQTDGKIFLSGLFASVAGEPHAHLARLNADGTPDSGFNPTANTYVYSLALQPDGKILAGGDFTQFGGQSRSRIARLNSTEPATQSLDYDGFTFTWQRGGNSPEVWRTTIEASTNLTNWSYLGEGTRIPGGWQFTAALLPPDSRARVRGYVTGGGYNSSSWFVQTISGPCFFITPPDGRTNNAGTSASFSVSANGSPPFSYQWLKNGTPLVDGGSVSGAQTVALTLNSVFGADAGGYSVIVSNSFGSITSAVAILRVVDPIITSALFTNTSTLSNTVTVTASTIGSLPVSYQWLKNGTNLPGVTTSSLTVSNIQLSDLGMYAIAASNAFGVAISNRMLLEANLTFPDKFLPSVNGTVYGVAEQPDGKIIVGGDFTTVDGRAWPILARLNPDGRLDTAFNPGTNISGRVYAVSALPDGRILAAGNFSLAQSNQTRFGLARLNPDGSLDLSFDPRPNNTVWALAPQQDGKFAVGGWFTSLGGQARSYVGRLNPDGSVDAGFDPGATGVVLSLAAQTDGKIVAVGWFYSLGGQTHEHIGRVNADGSVDAAFIPTANNNVSCLAVEADGAVLVGGEFTTLGNLSHKYIGRIGSYSSFNPMADYYANGHVDSLAVQADGKILVGGLFDSIGGRARYCLARLLPTGAADSTFDAAVNYGVPLVSVGTLANGDTLVAGAFTSLGGEARTNLARLVASDAASAQLTFDGSSLTWRRSGSCPEVNWACFESSTDGTNWVKLGEGTRITGGWRLDNVSLQASTMLRARGFATGGYYSSSSWHVESRLAVAGPPRILTDDGNFGFRTNRFGFNLSAASGQAVVVEASTNLVTWIPIHTNLMGGSGLFLFRDPESSPRPRRFYRARLYVGALPPPTIPSGSALGFQTGRFGFNIAGVAGQAVLVETSTNLQSWLPLQTNILDAALFYFSDSAASNAPSRFYRARLLP